MAWLEAADASPAGDGAYVAAGDKRSVTIAAMGPMSGDGQGVMDVLFGLHGRKSDDLEELRDRLAPLVNRAIEQADRPRSRQAGNEGGPVRRWRELARKRGAR